MMRQWALLDGGEIVNVVTADGTKAEVQQKYPTYHVAELNSLPTNVVESYRYWNERP